MLDWINHNHGAIEALASVSSLLVSLAAVFVAWRTPAIAAQFAKREYAKQVQDQTRALIPALERDVLSVSADVKIIRGRLNEQKAEPPSNTQWDSFHETMQLRLPRQLDLLYQQSGYVDEAEIVPYAEFAQRVRDYNNKRFNLQHYEKDGAYLDWPGYWERLNVLLKGLTSAAKKLSEQE